MVSQRQDAEKRATDIYSTHAAIDPGATLPCQFCGSCPGTVCAPRRRPRRVLRRQHHRSTPLHHFRRDVRGNAVPEAGRHVRAFGLGRRPCDGRRRRAHRRAALARRVALQPHGDDDHAGHERRALPRFRPGDFRRVRERLPAHREHDEAAVPGYPDYRDSAFAVRRCHARAHVRRRLQQGAAAVFRFSEGTGRVGETDGGGPEHPAR